jgi:hypothetical protein
MVWLFRKSATLIAIYSIALQALIWGFVPAGHFGCNGTHCRAPDQEASARTSAEAREA